RDAACQKEDVVLAGLAVHATKKVARSREETTERTARGRQDPAPGSRFGGVGHDGVGREPRTRVGGRVRGGRGQPRPGRSSASSTSTSVTPLPDGGLAGGALNSSSTPPERRSPASASKRSATSSARCFSSCPACATC